MSRIDDVKEGMRAGVLFATVASILALGAWLASRGTVFSERGLTIVGVVAFYYVVMPLAGGLVGLLLPFGHSRFGAALIGSITGVFVYGSAGVIFADAIGREHFWLVTLIAGIGVGAPVGIGYHRMYTRRWR